MFQSADSLSDLVFELPTPEPPALPSAEELKKAPEGHSEFPTYVTELNNLYKANRSHLFILHGNVNDYPDNTGVRSSLAMMLQTCYDHFWLARLRKAAGQPEAPNPSKIGKPVPIVARWTMSNGLEFATPESLALFHRVLVATGGAAFSDFKQEQCTPMSPVATLGLLNTYFRLSAQRFNANFPYRSKLNDPNAKQPEKTQAMAHLTEHPEINLTVVWQDAKMVFPSGDVASLERDRAPIAYLENWALDGSIATRNKIILVTPHLRDLQQSLHSGDSHISSIRIKRPDLGERLEYIANFSKWIAKQPAMINGTPRATITLSDDVSYDVLANMCAGMSRSQIEGVFMESWLKDQAVDLPMIAAHKKAAIEAEYGDILDIQQPAGGWNLLGGHPLLVEYANWFIVGPLRLGDRRRVSSGVLLVGPPGTGKSWFAQCLAGECGMNFILVDFSKLMGGIVGETEKNTDRLFEAVEAMAPCIVFMDEIDSAGLSRQSGGDSGVTARIFNRVMRWLSDEGRRGRVVPIAASNRPDMLDGAFIRAGRFDDIVPALPPGPDDAKGRLQIINALSKKVKILFSDEMKSTVKTEQRGLGRMLVDPRVWTGAEMERVMRLSLSNALIRVTLVAEKEAAHLQLSGTERLEHVRQATKSVAVTEPDWDKAMKAYKPKTRDVELQIDLALYYCNNADYCPPEYRNRMDNESALKERIEGQGPAAHTFERG